MIQTYLLIKIQYTTLYTDYCLHGCSCLAMKLCLTLLWPHGLQPARLLCPWDSPGKNTGAGCHFLPQGIFLTQGLNPGSPTLQADSLPSEPPGKHTCQCYSINMSHLLSPLWPQVHSPHLYLYSCPAKRFIHSFILLLVASLCPGPGDTRLCPSHQELAALVGEYLSLHLSG